MTIPVAEVVRWTASTVTVRCPYCGREHVHGSGAGHRVAHCDAPAARDGYDIPEYGRKDAS